MDLTPSVVCWDRRCRGDLQFRAGWQDPVATNNQRETSTSRGSDNVDSDKQDGLNTTEQHPQQCSHYHSAITSTGESHVPFDRRPGTLIISVDDDNKQE